RTPDGNIIQACDERDVGRLTIYKDHAPVKWSYDDKDEEFVKLELQSGRIKVWDKVTVGDHKDSLLAFIGDRFHYHKGTIVVAEIGDYQGEFSILNDTIRELTVRRTCDQ